MRLQLADRADAVALQRGGEGLADAPDHGHRLLGQEADRLGLADDRKAARLAEVRRDLGEELAVGQAGRNGDADLLLDARGELAPAPAPAAGRAAARCRRGRGTPRRSRAARPAASAPASWRAPRGRRATYFSMSGGITTASGQASSALNIGMAERTPVDAGDVAGGGDDAALAAADDHRACPSARDCRAFRSPRRRRRSRYGRDAGGKARDGGRGAGCRSARNACASPR